MHLLHCPQRQRQATGWKDRKRKGGREGMGMERKGKQRKISQLVAEGLWERRGGGSCMRVIRKKSHVDAADES